MATSSPNSRFCLEPTALISAFEKNPPERFHPDRSEIRQIYFRTHYDLTLTLDLSLRKRLRFVLNLVPKLKALFIGTTVTEYAPLVNEQTPRAVAESALAEFKKSGDSLLIFKDLPTQSPLLTAEDNVFADQLVDELRTRNFIILSGEALAYVPMTFKSIEEFMARFSKSRRYNYRRKLRGRAELSIDCIETGDPAFTPQFCDHLYSLYLNVYAQSEVHFDKLTCDFFKSIFCDRSANGRVFIYRHENLLLGFNLCFVVDDALVDKYVGFDYALSKEWSLYFVSWFHNLEYCLENGLSNFVAGWTDPEIKRDLGAEMTYTRHAVYVRSPLLRWILSRLKRYFEADRIQLRSER